MIGEPDQSENTNVKFSSSENSIMISSNSFNEPVNIFVNNKYHGKINSPQDSFFFEPKDPTSSKESYSVKVYSDNNETILQKYSHEVSYDTTKIVLKGKSGLKERTLKSKSGSASFSPPKNENIVYLRYLEVDGLGLNTRTRSVLINSEGKFLKEDSWVDYTKHEEITVESIRKPQFTFEYSPSTIMKKEGDKYYLLDAPGCSTECDNLDFEYTQYRYILNNSGTEEITWRVVVYASGSGYSEGASARLSIDVDYYEEKAYYDSLNETYVGSWECCFGKYTSDDDNIGDSYGEMGITKMKWESGEELWGTLVNIGSFSGAGGFGGAEAYIVSEEMSLVPKDERLFSLYKQLPSSKQEIEFPINIPPTSNSDSTTSATPDNWNANQRDFEVEKIENIGKGTLYWEEYAQNKGAYSLEIYNKIDDIISNISYSGNLGNSKTHNIKENINPTDTIQIESSGDLPDGTTIELNGTTRSSSYNISVENTENGKTYNIGNLKDGEKETITIDSYVSKSNIQKYSDGISPNMTIKYE